MYRRGVAPRVYLGSPAPVPVLLNPEWELEQRNRLVAPKIVLIVVKKQL